MKKQLLLKHNVLLEKITCIILFIIFPTAFVLYVMSGLGITAGAHRLWAHKSYKAKWPLRLILVAFNTLAFQVRFTLIMVRQQITQINAHQIIMYLQKSSQKRLFFITKKIKIW